jgi:outer membrane scaffolding protein for murein synthesis (MipA/OmpV family)
MKNVARWMATVLAVVVLAGCGKGDDKFRVLLDPVVARVTEKAKAAAALTGQAPAAVMEQTKAIMTDLAGLGADLSGLPAEGEKQAGMVAAGQAYRSATQRFVAAQEDFARSYARLEAARAKVRESLDAKVRTSKFSMDFWKETHDRLVLELDNVRKECEKGKAQLAAATASLQQSAEAAGAVLGRDKLISAAALDAHRKALDAVDLAKGA